ncbi:LacI family DNA-binding transcriptional regulator [Dictyobacter arantiisoli]|uniref:LacI family transcriptional regulator n=1 Tax=Dictyobacter arantiisoli TaxID=2014874 RepID=A0A5A5TBK9_9CHLR|nr:LacI family DNA-binding transcriptional regulator [Dictyobacter arantiisoli]GCF08403.1 LacI family transcriptional regulator [Dictyobacter arantiisoli]
MASSITAKDVAQHAEVSVGTVSRVFNNHSNVSEEIRQRVLKVAADLGYFRSSNQPAATNATGRVLREVGFLYSSSIEETPATTDPYWAPIFHGAESASRKANIKITYRTITDICRVPHLLTNMLYEMRLGGILLVGQADAATINSIRATRTPVVQVDNYAPDLSVPIDTILPDNGRGAGMAMDYLFSMGHQRIAFIGGPTLPGSRPAYRIHSVQQRWMQYCMALLDRGVPVEYDLVEAGNLTMEGGYKACKRLLERKVDFSAIFCVDDITAIGAMKALREAGRRVPEDVSLIGFDGIDLGQHITPALSTIRVDAEALGAVALKTLLERANEPDAPYVTRLIGVELIKRETVAPARLT